MTNKVKLPCALNKDNKLANIDDVKNGLACECFCPGCHEPVIARQGEKNAHSFAHRNNDCMYGYQSALHYMAKDLFMEMRFLTFKKDEKIVRYRIDYVEIEQRLDSIIPDILVVCDGKPFIVEIFVTHPVDDDKKAKIKKMQISAIEINLSKFHHEMIDKEMLKMEICNPDNFSWVYDADLDLIEQKRVVVQQFGMKIGIELGDSVGCPYLAGQKNQLAKFVPLEHCRHCHFCVWDARQNYIICGGFLPLLANPVGRQGKVFVNDKKVMFDSEYRRYEETFLKRLEIAMKIQFDINKEIFQNYRFGVMQQMARSSTYGQSNHSVKRNFRHRGKKY